MGHHLKHCSCYLDFLFSETKFSETETETFFRDQIFSKPKPRLFFRNQIFRNGNRNPQRFGKSFETEKFRIQNVNLCLALKGILGQTSKKNFTLYIPGRGGEKSQHGGARGPRMRGNRVTPEGINFFPAKIYMIIRPSTDKSESEIRDKPTLFHFHFYFCEGYLYFVFVSDIQSCTILSCLVAKARD